MRGRFIVFEGIDGSGKSTALAGVMEALADAGVDAVATREETETDLGAMVRRSISERWDPLATTYLFLADRAAHVGWIQAQLTAGRHVICDRFWHSTLAYQSVTLRGRIEVAGLKSLHAPITLRPDHVLLFQADPARAVARVAKRGAATPYEKVQFLGEVQAVYLALAKADRTMTILDAERDMAEVQADAVAQVKAWLA